MGFNFQFLPALPGSAVGLSLYCVSEIVQKNGAVSYRFFLAVFCCFQAALSGEQSEEFAAVSKNQPKRND